MKAGTVKACSMPHLILLPLGNPLFSMDEWFDITVGTGMTKSGDTIAYLFHHKLKIIVYTTGSWLMVPYFFT
jgi:hypothetical protein